MEKDIVYYSHRQSRRVLRAIEEHYGDETLYWMHREMPEEYIHLQVAVVDSKDDCKRFVTYGMGSRRMEKTHMKGFARFELVMFASPDFDINAENRDLILNELATIADYPFMANTYYFPETILPASPEIKERFGYDGYRFCETGYTASIGRGEKVHFMALMPVYEAELDHCEVADGYLYTQQMLDKFDFDVMYIDTVREPFIPENE